MTDARCEEIRELAPEIALGIVDGAERGAALEHLTACPHCRRYVEELSEVADELLLLAPHREVPVGFESRALAPLRREVRPRRRRRLLGVLVPVTTAVAAAAITLAIVSGDLRTASHYRHTLDEANGKEFESYALRQGGARAGTVFSYRGSPSWILVNVDPANRSGLESAQLVTDDGSRIPLGWFSLDSSGSSGGSIPVDPEHVSVLRLQPAGGGAPLVARFSD
jgi:Putative zinc-finger